MANTDRVNGFKPVGTLSGGLGAEGYIQRCLVDEDYAVALAVGDVVIPVASNESNGMPTIQASTAGDEPYGIIVGFQNWDDDNSNVTQTLDDPRISRASSRGYALVAISSDLIMEVQVSTGGDLEDGDIGANADLTAGGVDLAAQTSGMELDYSTMNTTNTLAFKILQIVERADNALGAHGKVLVVFNLHIFAVGGDSTGATGSDGVHA